MTRRNGTRLLGDLLLWVAAVLGALGIMLVLAGVTMGVRPLLFRSGSMAPTIGTGDLALARPVPASALRVGDIVSVLAADGQRVTHRVVAIEGTGAPRSLRLRGDANRASDQAPYVVSRADRVFLTVHGAGRVVALAAGPVGMFVLGLYAAGLLVLALRGPRTPRREPPVRGKRSARRPVAAAVAVAAVAAVVPAGSADAAAWMDNVTVSGTALTATRVLPPDSSSCGVVGNAATISWPEKNGGYDYEVVLRRKSDGQVVSTKQVTGSAVSQSYTAPGDFNLALLAVGTFDYTVDVRSYLAAAPTWRSVSTLPVASTIRVTIVSVLGLPVLGSVSCV